VKEIADLKEDCEREKRDVAGRDNQIKKMQIEGEKFKEEVNAFKVSRIINEY
jgi:hypothetical protein